MTLTRMYCLNIALAASSALAQGPHIQTTDPLPAEKQLQCFHLPSGFEIQLVAAEPDVQKPLNLNWDAKGRLWLSHTVEYPYPVKRDELARDGVTILDDLDSTGRARKIQRFADKLNIPMGIQPVSNGAIVFSIPKIYRLMDTNGDNLADVRQTLFTGFGYRDTHGLQNAFRRWIDGWVYANHAYLNHSTIPTPAGEILDMTSGNTYRFTIDGAKIELLTHGQVNPFGMTFDPLGNRFTADCHSRPVTMLLRGAHYPSFGKPHDGLGFAPEMINHDHGSTAIAGITYYAAEHFPVEYRDNLFLGNVVTRRVHRDKLVQHGSSYQAETQDDFITCDDPWFRPVDVRMGPDGALYIADFYNPIIGHYEVRLDHPDRDRRRGRVWRVIYRGTEGQTAEPLQPMADLTQLSIAELIKQLDVKNLLVRTMATNEIVDRSQQSAVAPVKHMMRDEKSSMYQKAHGLWILQRLNALDHPLVVQLQMEPSRLVRTQLVQALAERQPWTPRENELALIMLDDNDGFVRRAVVDAMSRHPNAKFIKPLLKCWDAANVRDTHLIHMYKIALRNHLLVDGTYHDIANMNSLPDQLWAHLAEASLAVPNDLSAQFLLQYLRSHDENTDVLKRVLAHCARHCRPERFEDLFVYLDDCRKDSDLVRQATLLQFVFQSLQTRGKPVPESLQSWAAQLLNALLEANGHDQLMAGLLLSKQIKPMEVYDRVAQLMTQTSQTTPVRTAATRTLAALDGPRSITLFGAILANNNEPGELRTLAANLLAQHAHLEVARIALIRQLARPAESLKWPIALGLSSSPHGASALLDALEQGSVSSDLLQNSTVEVLLHNSKFADSKEIDRRIRAIKNEHRAPDTSYSPEVALGTTWPRKTPSAETLQNIENVVASYQKASPDSVRGKKVFVKNCAVCHRIDEEGKQIGPQLDGIGQRGLHRILEDIIDPNLNVDPNFRVTLVMLETGKVVTGLNRSSQPEEMMLIDSQGEEIRISKEDIDEVSKLESSTMPANFMEVIPENDFHDLMAFLLSQKQDKKD